MSNHSAADQALFGHEEDRHAALDLQGGDPSALEVIVRLHQEKAIRVAYAITGNLQTAEDVAADAFVRAYERIHQFDATRPFAPWFFRIVANESIRAVRRTRRVSVGLDEWRESVPATHETQDPEALVLQLELRVALFGAIRNLPDYQRAAIVLKYYLGFKESEIAASLGIPRGTVKARLFLARRRLRKVLQRSPFVDHSDKEISLP